jgi:hypothetical protein
MAKHYRKKHPQAMKRKKMPSHNREHAEYRAAAKGCGYKFCPHCGGSLG